MSKNQGLLNWAKRQFTHSEGENGELKFGKFKTAMSGFMLMGTADDYSESRAEGNGVISSGLNALGNFAVGMMVHPAAYFAMQFARPVATGVVDGVNALQQYGRELDRAGMNKPFSNSTFVDTHQTYTMRQAGMNLARQSKYNMQQAMLGDEARMINM